MRSCVLALLAGLVFPVSARAAAVEVEVGNVTPGAGPVKVALCRSALDPDSCERNVSVAASGGSVEAEFPDVAPGRYAVAAYQDTDGTGQLRRGKLGIPLEPYGFSNGAGLTRKPNFDAAAFAVGEGPRRVAVTLRRPRRRESGDR